METRSSPSRKNTLAATLNHRTLLYLEFQSFILGLVTKAINRKASSLSAFQQLLNSPIFASCDDEYQLVTVKWPCEDGVHELDIQGDATKNSLMFYEEGKLCLTLKVEKNQLSVDITQRGMMVFTTPDIESIVHHFNQLFRAKKIVYHQKRRQQIEYISAQDGFHHDKREFDKRVAACADHQLTYRIENLFVNQAKRHANDYTFFLDWPDALKNNHQLKVTFSRAESFHDEYSWVLQEPVLLRSFSEYKHDQLSPGQLYYSLSINEVVDDDESTTENEILSFWLAVDGIVGELRDLKKGSSLTGNDVLAIYRYFDDILKIKHTLICDASRIENEEASINIPLRLLNALCTGQTWYQSKLPGVRLFDCKNFQSAHNGVITQNSQARSKALHELQQLPLLRWYSMLSAKNKKILLSLVLNDEVQPDERRLRSARLFNTKQSQPIEQLFGKKTVQQLAISLYNQSKKAQGISPALAQFSDLLTQGMHEDDEMKPDRNASDFWVLQKVHTLLWGSFFWIKELEDVQTVSMSIK